MQKKKRKCDGPTDRPTDTVTYSSRARDKNENEEEKEDNQTLSDNH